MEREAVTAIGSNAIAYHPVLAPHEERGARMNGRRLEAQIAIVLAFEKVKRLVRHPRVHTRSGSRFPFENRMSRQR